MDNLTVVFLLVLVIGGFKAVRVLSDLFAQPAPEHVDNAATEDGQHHTDRRRRAAKARANRLKAPAAGWPPPTHAVHGNELSFTYADRDGLVTDRRIINWHDDDEYDHCFIGWCLDRKEPRTFRKDRVQSWG